VRPPADAAPREVADAYLATVGAALDALRRDGLDPILDAAARIAASLRAGGKILACGNGGSAADAQHFATEFVSTLTTDHLRPTIPAIALTTDTSLLTAVANDFGFEHVFERQVEALGADGDVLVAISTSGRSANVVRAARRARERGVAVVALTGEDGGELAGEADVAIRVPSRVTAHVQECHLAIEQLIADLVERELYPR
jgi:D-sedoheptulose 7-phosphate isomerase